MTSVNIAVNTCKTPPLAHGRAISEDTANAAADWITLLMSGEATEDDRRRWLQWRKDQPDHELAWQHIEAVTGRFKSLPTQAAYQSLSPLAQSALAAPKRRKAIRTLLWFGAVGMTGTLATRTQTWQQTVADYRTATGEQRSLTLDDGTRITLNTASAINVRFDHKQRLVRLISGEMMITTGHAGGEARPFIIETAEGKVRALGTEFTVRQRDGSTTVTVLESKVEVTPVYASRYLLNAGKGITFTRDGLGELVSIDAQSAAWMRQQIIADNVRLADFVADLSRYRAGVMRCDPAVADLRFSGVFPLGDTDRILAMLPNTLPIQVRTRTRYWVTLEAAT
ncbi:FecR domain-containing protein [Herminiimonas contaminans]|uniref:FecR domain-containing protein n=1 Tax=Herminiimonas contaminans TaxID=1111140 RepID=A0ABS0EWK9_9BURK|nr:FecR domain-containing protein [Herminiimonas contaminans]MBF8179227.1 FecR domain-containing protein [Herminiimonas contaminans]